MTNINTQETDYLVYHNRISIWIEVSNVLRNSLLKCMMSYAYQIFDEMRVVSNLYYEIRSYCYSEKHAA